jgi:menaquinol-cytochrome c reductase iron-sulfur subunit
MNEADRQRVGDSVEEAAQAGRRRFLSYAGGLLAAVIAAALALPLIRFFVDDAFASRPARWLKLGARKDVRLNRPQLFHVSYLDTDGWRQTTRRQAVYVVTHDAETYTVFSNICTHLGCPVGWDEAAKLFLCPCHGGGFSIDGDVVKGPPPRPLDRFEHKFEGDVLYVRIVGA